MFISKERITFLVLALCIWVSYAPTFLRLETAFCGWGSVGMTPPFKGYETGFDEGRRERLQIKLETEAETRSRSNFILEILNQFRRNLARNLYSTFSEYHFTSPLVSDTLSILLFPS